MLLSKIYSFPGCYASNMETTYRPKILEKKVLYCIHTPITDLKIVLLPTENMFKIVVDSASHLKEVQVPS